MSQRALVLRALGLGDLLAGVPALRVLRRALPDHEVVLAAPGVLAPLVETVDAVDRLLPVGELEPVPWEGPPPDVGVDLHGNGPASRRLVEALAPGRLVAFEAPGGPRWDPDEHERRRWCRLVSQGLGVPLRVTDPESVLLPPPPGPPAVDGAVVVHPGAASGSRRWPLGRYADVARALARDGHRVVVTGSPEEVHLARAVARAARLDESAVLAGTTGLAGLAALVAAARLVVCGDTGVAHLASAYATRSVVLFGPVPPSSWGPPAGGPHTALWRGGPAYRGDPHADEVDPLLTRLTVDRVIDACRRRLAD